MWWRSSAAVRGERRYGRGTGGVISRVRLVWEWGQEVYGRETGGVGARERGGVGVKIDKRCGSGDWW